jgi:hypothetical protein
LMRYITFENNERGGEFSTLPNKPCHPYNIFSSQISFVLYFMGNF